MSEPNLGSEQDELYYFAKNFNKLKFSNQAYIDSTQKRKEDNEKEIEKLKKDYEKLRTEVNMLKKTSLYAPGRTHSASNSEYTYYRLKYDQARQAKLKSKEEWKKNTEKYNELKSEAKLISDDNNPYVKRIKLLENKLDKAMIKYNEAMSIRRTYEQILARLKEERAGYDNQIAAIQKSLKAKGHDLNEFKLLLQDSKQARTYSELLVKNTELSKEAFEEHFEQLIQAHKRENLKEIQKEKMEEKKRRQKQNDVIITSSDEKVNYNKGNELEKKVKDLEEADKLIRETTGADDINEICQKYSNLLETKENLKNEKKDLEKMFNGLKYKHEILSNELKKLKYSSQDEITRKEIEDHEKIAEKTLANCELVRQKLRKQEKLMIDLTTGINGLIEILSNKIFEENFNDEYKKNEDDIPLKQVYYDLFHPKKEEENKKEKSEEEKKDKKAQELKHNLSLMNDLFKHIEERSIEIRHKYHYDEEEKKLDKKEENEIGNIYIEQKADSNPDSEYGPEEDIDPELPNKDNGNRNDFNMRPYSAAPAVRNKISIQARNKY